MRYACELHHASGCGATVSHTPFSRQIGPPYLLEKNRDFYQEACKVNPGVMIIHDHLKAKTNPNYTGSRHHRKASGRGAGFTAAHYAALYANVILLEMLIRAEADLNIQATCGRTPLLIACAGTYPNHHKVTKILVSAGGRAFSYTSHSGHRPIQLGNSTCISVPHSRLLRRCSCTFLVEVWGGSRLARSWR